MDAKTKKNIIKIWNKVGTYNIKWNELLQN